VIQDLAALNKMELLLWDVWVLMQADRDAGRALIDEVAARTLAADGVTDVRRLYSTRSLAVPESVRSFSPATGPRDVTLAAD